MAADRPRKSYDLENAKKNWLHPWDPEHAKRMRSDVHRKIMGRIALLGYPLGGQPSSKVVKTIDWLLEYLHPTYKEGPDHDGKWVIVASNSAQLLGELAKFFPPAFSLNFFKAIHGVNTELIRRLSRDDYPDSLVPLGIESLRNGCLIFYEHINKASTTKLAYYEQTAMGLFAGWSNPWMRLVATVYTEQWSSHTEKELFKDVEKALGDTASEYLRDNVETVRLMMNERTPGPKFKVSKE